MKDDTIYWLAEKGPVFDLCQKWCREYFSAIDRARDFAERNNMQSFRYDIGSGRFSAGAAKRGEEYPDWTKPKGSDRLCWPKKKTALYAEYKAMKGAPRFDIMLSALVGEVPSNVSYEYDDCRGGSMVGGIFSPGCYTFNSTEGPFLIDIPDVHGYFAKMKERHPDAKWTNYPGEPLTLPECRKINRKEWDILKLQHEIAREQVPAG